MAKPIAEFGLIQRKISSSRHAPVCRRKHGLPHGRHDRRGPEQANGEQPAHSPREIQRRIEEYAVECSILKVYGSEMLTLVADELVATMGGYGYVEEYPASATYRDARINRIFEGTNEINRLIITGWLMKRALSGQLPLLAAIKKLMDEVMQPPCFDSGADAGRAAGARGGGAGCREKDGAVCGGRGQPAVHDGACRMQQEVMADLADMIMQVFALESALLRARKLAGGRQGRRRRQPRP